MMTIDVCYGLIYDKKADTVLVVQNEHGGWSFPGGAKEPSETLEQALLREIKEETNLDVEIISEIETSERYSPTHDIFHLFYVILKDEKAYGAPIAPRDEEIMIIQWIAFDDVKVYLPWYKNGIYHLKDKIVTP
jgi:8-oxo-dGTP diphosphatase